MLEYLTIPVGVALVVGVLLANVPKLVTWLKTRAGATGKEVVADANKVATAVGVEAAKVVVNTATTPTPKV